MSYKALIKVYNDPKFYANAITLATEAEAEQSGLHKFTTWTMAEEYKVVESDETPNYTFVDGQLTSLEVPSV
jgi:hypothetical protein